MTEYSDNESVFVPFYVLFANGDSNNVTVSDKAMSTIAVKVVCHFDE